MSADGADITPRSSKARGMIGLLCCSDRFVRSRSWLQAHLWSDRGREQSAGSLRQSLMEIRRTFGEHADCILSDRQDIQLCPARVTLADADPSREFLEGIEVRDEQFEDWLRVERSRHHTAQGDADNSGGALARATDASKISKLVILNDTPVDGMESFFAACFADSVAKNLDEFSSVVVLRESQADPGRNDLLLRTSANFSAGLAGLRVTMERAVTRQSLWSGAELMKSRQGPPIDDDKLLRLVNHASEGICEALYSAANTRSHSLDVAIMERRAIRLMFGMRAEGQLEAERLLQDAHAMQPRATHLSWRAMLRLIMLIEAHDGLSENFAQEAIMLAHKAVEMAPLNSLVLSAAANVALVLEADNVRGLEFAERAIRANPANPFAIDALSIAALYHGDTQRARHAQHRARYVAGKTQFSHWFDMGCSKMAAISGDYDVAQSMALRAAAGAGSFRPPLRYLIVLYLRAGEIEKAQATIEKLKKIEPSFELDKMWHDDAYPIRDLRRSKLVSKDAKAMLT